MSEEPLTCRWFHGRLKLDVLVLREEVLGYTNIWYQGPLDNAISLTLPGGQIIRVITAPYFLGNKMEAFRRRGNMDFLASHDLEDFVAVIEGRSTLLQEIADSPSGLTEYLAEAAGSLLGESRFLDALPGFVLDDTRVPLTLERLNQLARLNPKGLNPRARRR
jgi:hypothetical protein